MFLRVTMWKVFGDSKALLYMPFKKEKTRELLHMYIKLLLERLFKDLFFGRPIVHYNYFQLCLMKHKIIVLKSTTLLFSIANTLHVNKHTCIYLFKTHSK